MSNIFFNAQHSPIGAFASFTLGYPGASGGLGLELGKPADQSVFIGLEELDGKGISKKLNLLYASDTGAFFLPPSAF